MSANQDHNHDGHVLLPDDVEQVQFVTESSHNSGQRTIEDAISSLPHEGGIVMLGAGRYQISSLELPSDKGIVLHGRGRAATLVGSGDGIVVPGAVFSELRELKFEGFERCIHLSHNGYHSRLVVDDCAFNNFRFGIDGNIDGVIVDPRITDCEFGDGQVAITLRSGRSEDVKIIGCKFGDLSHRAIVTGDGRGRHHSHVIKNNHIEGITGDRQLIGILSYADQAVIADNKVAHIAGSSRHEAISYRGSKGKIANNTVHNAGGHLAAISLAGAGPTKVVNNDIWFDRYHSGNRWGIDSRQPMCHFSGNLIEGYEVGMRVRRGGSCTISHNHLNNTGSAENAILFGIATSSAISSDHLGRVTITDNQIHNIHGKSGFIAIEFNIQNQGGSDNPAADDVHIRGNTITDIQASSATGLMFRGVYQSHAHMRRVIIKDNILNIGTPIHRSVDNLEDVIISDNIG